MRLDTPPLHADAAHLEALLDSAPGLPEPLPPGETILWQSAPDWKLLALHVLHVRAVLGLGVACTVLATLAALAHGAGAPFLALAIGAPVLGTTAALGLAALAAWLLARVCRYTLTDRRLLMRVGLIVPINLNIPLTEITDVAIRPLGGEAGDLPLRVRSHDRMYYMLLWPHVRPFRFRRVEPMLRALPDGVRAGEMLVGALRRAELVAARESRTAPLAAPPAPVLLAAE